MKDYWIKKIIGVLLFGLVLTCAYAQKKTIEEGIVEYDISYPEPTEEMKRTEDALPKSLTIYFTSAFSRVELKTILGPTIMITNNDLKETHLLMEMMGKKIAMKTAAQRNGDDGKIEFPKETKTIAGYKCKKAVITTIVSGVTMTLYCYYTDALPPITAGGYSDVFKKINGFMLEYETKQNGMHMVMRAKKVSPQKLSPELFVIPKEYEVISQYQFMGQPAVPADTLK